MSSRHLFAAIFLFAGLAFAQTDRGSITGTVSDPAGAVVANASIASRNTATDQVFIATSTETGNYTVAQLPPGSYELTVDVQGFKKYIRQGLTLAPTQVMRIDVALEVGSNTESVTVTAEATLLKTEGGEVAQTVTSNTLNNLPLLGIGPNGASAAGIRNPWAMAQLIPGAQFSIGQGTGFAAGLPTLIVNGAPNNSASYRIEGQDATPNGTLATFTYQVQPSAEAIQEVAVQTSNFAAEYGTVGGGLFNATMKSGSNQYHGSLYNYNINEAYNSRQPYTGLLNKARRNDYGGTLGGPIQIPKLYNGRDRTFFFWNFEQFRETQAVFTQTATVPIAAYRNGDFGQVIIGSGLNGVPRNILVGSGAAQRNYLDPLGRTIQSGAIFDPNTQRGVVCSAALSPDCIPGSIVQVRDQFPGNIISDRSRFDAVALKIQNLIPGPAGPNAAQIGANYNNPQNSHRTTEIPSLKVDQTLGSKGRLSFYWSSNTTSDQFPVAGTPGSPEGFPSPITSAIANFVASYTLRLNYDHTITPTLLAHFGVGFLNDHLWDDTLEVNYNPLQELGLRGATINRNFPTIVIGASAATGGMSQMGPSFQTHQFIQKPTANTSFTWVKNNHTYKFGGDFRIEGNPNRTFAQPPWASAGLYNFNAEPTTQTSLQGVATSQGSAGFGYASFLLGRVPSFGLGVPAVYRIGRLQWAFFAQDTWKLTRKLTLDYGLRWDYGTYSREQYGRSPQFDATVANPSAAGHPGGSIFEANCNCRFANNYPYAFGPRLGMAYQLNSRTVIRAGLGMVYNNGPTGGFAPLNYQTGGNPGFGEALFRLQDGPPDTIRPVFPNINPGALPLLNTVGNAPTLLDRNAGRMARQVQWSVGIQREINRDLVVEASYVANRGAWWTAGGLAPLNLISEETLARYQLQIGNLTHSGLLNTNIGNLNTQQRTTLANQGVTLPYSTFPGTQTVRQSLMPFPQFSTNAGVGLIPSAAPLGRTWYDSLQASVTQRLTHGLNVNANFTWAKTLDLMSSPDVLNRKLGKNLSGSDLPLQLRISAQYVTPRISSGPLGNRFTSFALSDWTIGWYVQYQSAPVLARPASASLNPIDRWLGRGPGPAQLKPGESLWSTDWVDYDGNRRTDPLDINCHCFDPTKTIVLNRNAWESVPDGRWANHMGTIRDYRGIRQPVENFNFGRVFRIKERATFQIRAEFSNILNRTRLPQPAATGFTANPTTFPAGRYRGAYSGGFGTINPTSGTQGYRSGTIVGRLTF